MSADNLDPSEVMDDRTTQAIRSDIQSAVGGDTTYTKLSKSTIERLLPTLRGNDPDEQAEVWRHTRETALREKIADEVGFEYDLGGRSRVFSWTELLLIDRALSEEESS